MSIRYTVRMQFGPHQDSEIIRREILNTCRAGRVDEVMFFAFAEEQNDGHDSLERLRQWMDAIRPWKHALESEGIEVSLNPWHSILHEDRHRRLKADQPWQTLVDFRGNSAKAQVCPLDADWRTYYAAALRLFAAEKFRVIWIDDDIRYHNHGPLDWGGCWCPLHVEAFNRRAGTTASRDEIVAACLDPGAPHPWRTLWLDMWDELHCEMIDSWRRIVEGAGSRLGLMSSNLEVHSAEGRRWDRWWEALAQRFPATHRPHFWTYSDSSGEILPFAIGQMQQNRMVQPADVESAPEIENFPYGPWNKSFRQTTAQMALATAFGSDRLAVSLYDFMGNLPFEEIERADYLGRVKPMLNWLSEQFPPGLDVVGVGTPWHPDMARKVRTNGRRDWRALEVSTRAWDHVLAPLGHGFQKKPSDTVNAISGDSAWCYDDDDLRQWLTRGLLLDGPAADILLQRGFGEYIGLEDARFVTQDEVLYSIEESLDSEFGYRKGAQISVNAWRTLQPRMLQGRLAPKARIISVLLSPLQERVGHGGLVFENALGGRVAVMPWSAAHGMHLFTLRQAQLDKVIAWLSKGKRCGSVQGGAWLIPVFFTDHEAVHRAIIWNAGQDAVRGFTVTRPTGAGRLRSAVHCSPDGARTEALIMPGKTERILPRGGLQPWECVVIEMAPEKTEPMEAFEKAELAIPRFGATPHGQN